MQFYLTTVERMFQNSFRRRNSACQQEAQRDSGGEEDAIHSKEANIRGRYRCSMVNMRPLRGGNLTRLCR